MKILIRLLLAALIVATVACGYGSKNYTPTAGAVPAISQLDPGSAPAGGAAFILIVNGSNFGSKAVVNWNGAPQSTTFITGNQLTVAIPATMIATSGDVKVTVTNPGTTGNNMYGSGGTLAETSTPMTFTIN